jgi:hypothetical protein
MKTQDVITYILVAGAAAFLLLIFLKPAFSSKKKDNPEKNEAGCDNDCNCK